MRTLSVVIGAAAIVVGGIWIGQGAGFIPGSFMTGSKLWFVIGLVVALVGIVLVVVGLRGMRRRDG